MLSSIILVLASCIAGFASAQNSSSSGSTYPYLIDPGTVSFQQRNSWCMAQLQSCPKICGGVATPNTCDSNTLQYACTCSDGSTPNITQYTTTVPYFECQTYRAQCVGKTDDAQAQAACNKIPCGSKSPDAALSSASAAMASSTMSSSSSSMSATATATSSGSSSSSSSSSKNGAAPMLGSNQAYGLGAAVIGVFGFIGGVW